MSESAVELSKLVKLFSNSTSRALFAVWLLVKGSRFSLRTIAELISIPEDALEAKLQSFAGMGLVYVVTESGGERLIEFTPSPEPDMERTLADLFKNRQADFNAVDLKLRSLIYKNLLTSPL